MAELSGPARPQPEVTSKMGPAVFLKPVRCVNLEFVLISCAAAAMKEKSARMIWIVVLIIIAVPAP